jgi:NADH-ubiquinone oxidoreductase chain 6
MHNLIILNENLINGYNYEILNIFYIFIIICGISVIIVKNPIISVLFLIGLFSGVASYLIILGLSFIGLSYLIVYVGAVSILFLFILMLINIRISELQNNTSNSVPLIIATLIIFSNPLFQLLPYNISILNKNSYLLTNSEINVKDVFFVVSKM